MTYADPPTSRDSTTAVALLYACMVSRGARQAAKRLITGADFYDPAHEVVYQAINAMDRAGRSIDAVTVRAYLQGTGRLTRDIDVLLVEVITSTGHPDSAMEYARIIRSQSLRRHLADAGRWITQRAEAPGGGAPERLAAEAVTRLTGLRDHGSGDVTALTLDEVLAVPDEGHQWVIPGLLERADRLLLTGSEGAGKSVLSRQFAVMGAAGLHPFTNEVMPPIKSLIIDCENRPGQVRRAVAPLVAWITAHSTLDTDPRQRVLMDTPGRIDVLTDRGLSRIHQAIDAWQPDLVVIGPVYRMTPRSLNSDDDAAPFLAALDTITERGAAIVVEAHAGHTNEDRGKQKVRSLRPRGASALMGWPEFGLGLRGLGGGLADLEPFRGGREQRGWPGRVKRAPGNRWVETSPDARPEDQPPPEPEDPQGAMW